MKAATLNELKKELQVLDSKQVLDICIRLAKYKKENKELLTYLLFEADNDQQYIKNIQQEIDLQLDEINRSSNYFIKKSLRKLLRTTNKYIKYAGKKEIEADLLLYFCKQLKNSGIRIKGDTVLTNLYDRQLQRIRKAISTLHEDLQYDYEQELEGL